MAATVTGVKLVLHELENYLGLAKVQRSHKLTVTLVPTSYCEDAASHGSGNGVIVPMGCCEVWCSLSQVVGSTKELWLVGQN